MKAPLLEMKSITKSFPGVKALDGFLANTFLGKFVEGLSSW